MPDFNIEKFVNYLEKHKDQLDNLYRWKPNLDGLKSLGIAEDNELAKLRSPEYSYFQKDEQLKNILSRALNEVSIDSKQFERIALWIIHMWGRIPNPPNTNPMKSVFEFLKTDRPKFDRIASASKVGGFMTPHKRIIYDSRVSYSLNWIILSQNAGDKFFPMPEGRNRKLNAFDLNVLIRLQFVESYKPKVSQGLERGTYISDRDKQIFISNTDAYYEANRLVGAVNELLWRDNRKLEPFYTEMLLFALADTVVFEDITKRVKFHIE